MKIMLPMIATVDEFQRARTIVRREQAMLAKQGHVPPLSLQLGVMVEVPSLLFELPEIVREADFLSIGTNDLMQFLFAADRENKRVADRFDPLGAGALRALRSIVEAASEANCPVTVCGEMGVEHLDRADRLAGDQRSKFAGGFTRQGFGHDALSFVIARSACGEAIQFLPGARLSGLLRCARNDGVRFGRSYFPAQCTKRRSTVRNSRLRP
eukprot:gene1381-biopygen1200